MTPKKTAYSLNINNLYCIAKWRQPVSLGACTLLFGLMSWTTAGNAKIYKTVDAQGNVSYTDVAPTQREQEAELAIEELNTFTSPAPAPEPLPTVVLTDPDDDEALDPAPERYRSISIASPSDDEAIRANNGNISIAASLTPDLHTSHNLRFYVDGNPAATGKGLSLALTNVDRGTHSAKVAVVDDDGNVIAESSSVSFHVLRAFRRPTPSVSRN